MALRGPLAGTVQPNSSLRGPLAGASTDGSSRYAQIAQQQEQERIAQENQIAASQARYANSVGGLAVNTAKEAGKRLVSIPVDFAKGTWQAYQATPDKIVNDVTEGAEDMQTGGTTDQQNAGFVKGAIKAGGRTSLDFLGAVFAPISSAIGATLKATGQDRLMDQAGQVIADKSGITDWPAFQRFAMAHPNAGEDFNRIANAALLGEAGGESVIPKNVAEDSLVFANKLVGNSKTLRGVDAVQDVKHVPVADTSVPSDVNITRNERRLPVQEEPSAFSDNNVQFNNDYRQGQDIQMGSTPRSSLPDVRYPEPNPNRVGPYTYEPIKEPASTAPVLKGPLAPVAEKAQASAAMAPVKESINVPSSAKTETPSPAKPIDVPQGKVESTRGSTLLKAAVEKDLIDSYKDLPTHDKMNMKQQAEDSVDFALSNRALAESIAMGEHTGQLPSNIIPESIYHAMERIAIKEGDVALIDRLSRSNVPTQAGRGLKALDSSDPLSPVAILRSVRKVLAEKSGKKGDIATRTKKIIQEESPKLDNELSMAAPKRASWEQFVKEITCGY